MLNDRTIEASLVTQAVYALRTLLERVPSIVIGKVEIEPPSTADRADIIAHLTVLGRSHILICELKANGQPRYVKMALLQLEAATRRLGESATPVIVAPYLSPPVQAMCEERGVGYLDLEGNAYLSFDGVFIDRKVATKPAGERREIRSIFSPKSAQVLRIMLRDPGRGWRVAKLARAAKVSIGHVSNVLTALRDRDWAQVGEAGIHLSKPSALLDTWRDEYEPPAGKRQHFYTTLHGSAFDEAVRSAFSTASSGSRAAFCSFSAAHWLAPYARSATQHFFADEGGLQMLWERLKLQSSSKGENITITVLRDDGPLQDTTEPTPGIVCTSAVQTYLDLCIAGERGREAAEHLRQERLKWSH